MKKFILTLQYFVLQIIEEIKCELERGWFSNPVIIFLTLICISSLYVIGRITLWILVPGLATHGVVVIFIVSLAAGILVSMGIAICYAVLPLFKEFALWVYDNWTQAKATVEYNRKRNDK